MVALPRDIFTDEHELYREQFRRFAEAEIAPRIDQWNREGKSDRDTWRRVGGQGFLGAAAPEAYGGGGGYVQSEGACTVIMPKAPLLPREGPTTVGLPFPDLGWRVG